MRELCIREIISHLQMRMLLHQRNHTVSFDTRGVPRQSQRATRQQHLFPYRQGLLQHSRDLTKVLNAIRQIAYKSMHMWPPWHFLHMYIGLTAISVCQHHHARGSFAAHLKQVATSRSPPTLINLFVENMLTMKILPNEHGCRLHILPLCLNSKGIIARRQGQEQRSAATCQRIKDAQAFHKTVGIASGKDSYIEQHLRKNLVGLPLIATHLS